MVTTDAAREIVRNADVLGGEPTVAGTRVPVRSVVLMHRIYGDIGHVQKALPTLTHADIAGALDYYREHREEIERHISENETDAELREAHT